MTGPPRDEFSHLLRFLERKHFKEMLIKLWPHFLLLPDLAVKFKSQFFENTKGKKKVNFYSQNCFVMKPCAL